SFIRSITFCGSTAWRNWSRTPDSLITSQMQVRYSDETGRQALSFEVVLDDHWHAVERSRETIPHEPPVEIVGLFFCIGLEDDDGVDRGSVLVVGLDALEVLAHQHAAGKLARLHRLVGLGR